MDKTISETDSWFYMMGLNDILIIFDGNKTKNAYSYNGSSLSLINKGTSDYMSHATTPIIYESKVYFRGKNTANEYSFYEYDGTSVKNIVFTQGSSDANLTDLLSSSNFMIFNNKLVLSQSSSKYYIVNTDYSLSNLNISQIQVNGSIAFNNKCYFVGYDDASNAYGLYTYDETTGSQNISSTNGWVPLIHDNYLYILKDDKLTHYDGTSFTEIKTDNSLGYLSGVSFSTWNTFLYNNLIYVDGIYKSVDNQLLEYNPITNIIKRASFPITLILKDTKTVLDLDTQNMIEFNGKYLFNNDYGCYVSE